MLVVGTSVDISGNVRFSGSIGVLGSICDPNMGSVSFSGLNALAVKALNSLMI
jgi:hypothetical protein